MEVVLLERIEKLGQMGDVVRVKDGYARNYLLPQNKALRATKTNMERFEQDRAQLEATNLEQRKEAEAVAQKVDGEAFVILRQAGDSGQLYGSVSTRDIAGLVTEGGMTIKRGQVILDHPIKAVGLHDVRISLHPEVTVSVVINVARTEDEAERQARGEAVGAEAERLEQVAELEAESTALAAEVFEDEDIAQAAVEELETASEEIDEADGGAVDSGRGGEASEGDGPEDDKQD